jgi:uncharacterized protein YgiM (DUF1202 family)
MSMGEQDNGLETMIATGAGKFGTTMSRRRLLRLSGSVGMAALAGLLVKRLPAAAAGSSGMRTLTSLNLRAKPSTSGKVLLVMPYGALVLDAGSSSNGYIKVDYQGTTGWAAAEFLISTNSDAWPPMTGSATATKKANLRQYPVPGSHVVTVVVKGGDVQTSDKEVDGYRFVAYGGSKGWLLESAIGEIEDGIHPGDHAHTTANVNLRAQPSTSAKVMLVIPAGSEVVAWAQTENGFRTVSYGNTSGWVYEAYLEA